MVPCLLEMGKLELLFNSSLTIHQKVSMELLKSHKLNILFKVTSGNFRGSVSVTTNNSLFYRDTEHAEIVTANNK